MMEEFNLSEFVRTTLIDGKEIEEIDVIKVREFIKRLKEEIEKLSYSEEEIEKFSVTKKQRIGFNLGLFSIRDKIDKLAGEKLI